MVIYIRANRELYKHVLNVMENLTMVLLIYQISVEKLCRKCRLLPAKEYHSLQFCKLLLSMCSLKTLPWAS